MTNPLHSRREFLAASVVAPHAMPSLIPVHDAGLAPPDTRIVEAEPIVVEPAVLRAAVDVLATDQAHAAAVEKIRRVADAIERDGSYAEVVPAMRLTWRRP